MGDVSSKLLRLRNSANASGSPRSQEVHIETPARTCRICRSRKPKAVLARWVRQGAGWIQDEQQRLPGRGFYTCSPECAQKLLKTPLRK